VTDILGFLNLLLIAENLCVRRESNAANSKLWFQLWVAPRKQQQRRQRPNFSLPSKQALPAPTLAATKSFKLEQASISLEKPTSVIQLKNGRP